MHYASGTTFLFGVIFLALIEIRNLCKTFGTGSTAVHALEDVSLDIEAGEIFGIIGLSGAGKSTLVRCMNLLERPTSGTVTVDGADMTALSDKELRAARREIGMIFQSFNLLMQRNALANVRFPLELAGVPKKEANKRAQELLDNLNRQLGVTVVVITHEMRVVERICSRVAIIADSRIAEMGPVQDVFLNPQTEAAKKLVLPSRAGKLEGFSSDSENRAVDECRGRLIRLAFDGETTDRPIIADMILSCGAPVSIVYADTRSIEGRLYGHTVLQLPSDPAVAEKLRRWLSDEGVIFTEEE